MIIKFSLRGNPKDLALHISNEEQNEQVRSVHCMGSVAKDPVGFVLEKEAVASPFTGSMQKFIHFIISPDPKQYAWDDERVIECAQHFKEAYGVGTHAHLIMEHVKDERVHYHVVVPRFNEMTEKMVSVPYSYNISQSAAKSFARENDITLADGFYKDHSEKLEKSTSFDHTEKHQLENSGITKEERMRLITHLWETRDTRESFIQSLEQHGYALARGNRPFLVVDLYGNVNNLSSLITDKKVRTKHVREFLGDDLELPDVEETKIAAKKIRDELIEEQKRDSDNERIEEQREHQKQERRKLEAEVRRFHEKQRSELKAFESKQLRKRQELRRDYQTKQTQIKVDREAKKPTGLAGFLARVSGVEHVRQKLHKQQDKQRLAAYRSNKAALQEEQRQQLEEFNRNQWNIGLEVERQKQVLKDQHKRQQDTLKKTIELEKQRRLSKNAERSAKLDNTLEPKRGPAWTTKAAQRHTSDFGKETRMQLRKEQNQPKQVKPTVDFDKANELDNKTLQLGGSSSPPHIQCSSPAKRHRNRDKDSGRDR